jgi:hypothetical protein
MTSGSSRPIPFRKPKRKRDEPLVRPTARIIPAGCLEIDGETLIGIMSPAEHREAA